MGQAHDTAPLTGGFSITKSDTTEFAILPRAIWVGGDGDIALFFPDKTSVTLVGVVAGTLLPVRPLKVLSTGTSATSIVGLY